MAFPVGAAIAAGGSILGGLIGAGSQGSSNKTNLKIARETNAQNLAIYNDQKQYNTDMWNAQNAYNTPLAQRQRYEDAGINPYLALGNITAGSAQSSPIAPNAPNMVTPQVQPVTAMAEGLQRATLDAANVYTQVANAEKVKAEAEGQRIENGVKYEMLRTQINNMKKQGTGFDYDNDLKQLAFYIGDNTKDVSIQTALDNLHNLQTQGRIMQVQEDLMRFDLNFKNKHAEEQFKAEMSRIYTQNMVDMMNARTNQFNAQTNRNLSEAQIRGIAQDILESVERTTGIHLDNTQHRRSMEFLVGRTKAELQNIQSQTGINTKVLDNYDTDKWFRRGGDLLNGGSEVTGMYSNVKKVNPKKPKPIKGFKVGGFK